MHIVLVFGTFNSRLQKVNYPRGATHPSPITGTHHPRPICGPVHKRIGLAEPIVLADPLPDGYVHADGHI